MKVLVVEEPSSTRFYEVIKLVTVCKESVEIEVQEFGTGIHIEAIIPVEECNDAEVFAIVLSIDGINNLRRLCAYNVWEKYAKYGGKI